jgi:hypothetical protein
MQDIQNSSELGRARTQATSICRGFEAAAHRAKSEVGAGGALGLVLEPAPTTTRCGVRCHLTRVTAFFSDLVSRPE